MGARPTTATFLYAMRYVLLAVFILCILPVFAFNMQGPPPPVLEVGGQDYFTNLATCLTKNRIRMFGSDSCGNCKRQKKLFGDAFEVVDYVDCHENDKGQKQACEDNKIDRYPTWIQYSPSGIETTRKAGVLTATQLEEFSACKISP